MILKRAIEFDFTGSQRLSAELTVPLRRTAFQVRRQNGMPRAVALSLLVHVSIGMALFFQLVPQQFIRVQENENELKPLEVFLIAEPAGAAGGAPQPIQTIVSAPAAVPERIVKAEKKPEPIKKEAAEYSPPRKTKVLPAAVPVQAEEGAKGSAGVAAGSPQPAQAADTQGSGGRTGAGNGSGGPYNTNFGQADAPRFLQYVQPNYPLAARQQGREGTVVLRLTIDERGNLVQVEVVASPSDGFTESAVDAVKRSTFAPAQLGGKAVASRAVLPVRFALKH
jgi:periplasmic protein TonB